MKRGPCIGVTLGLLVAALTGACSAAAGDSVDAVNTSSAPASPATAQASASAAPSALAGPSLVPCPSSPPPEASPIFLTADEALSCDLAAAAAGRGTTIEEEHARYRAAEIVGEIAERIARERPEIFVGSALSDQPFGAPTIYIKGLADTFVLELVAAAEIEIFVADNQTYSFGELEERSTRISMALLDLGFSNFGTDVDIRTGRIDAAVTIEDGLPADPAAVIALLPADLRDAVDLTMSDTPVAVDTIPE